MAGRLISGVCGSTRESLITPSVNLPPDAEVKGMSEQLVCSNCHEEIEDEPIRRGDAAYCCEACAFEAGRSKDCSGRTDSHFDAPDIAQA